METSLPVAERPRRPEWMKVRAPSRDGRYFDVQKLVHGLQLNTICEEARCPNISECWGRGTATFQILGDTCTRACRYCYVKSGRPGGGARSARAAPRRAGGRADGAEARRRDVGRPRRRCRPRRGALRGDDPRAEGEAAGCVRRGAHAGLPRRRGGGARDGARGAPGGLQPQHRDRPPPARADARREGELRQGAVAASPREGARRLQGADEVGDHRRARRDERRDRRDDARSSRERRRRRDDRPVPPAELEARGDRPLGASGRVPLAPRAGRGARFRLRLRRPARPLELSRRRAAPRGRGAAAALSRTRPARRRGRRAG